MRRLTSERIGPIIGWGISKEVSHDANFTGAVRRLPWNKSRYTGSKPPLKPRQIWGIRARIQIAKRIRDLALFDLALDSKLRGCDLVRVRISDIALHGGVQTRATVTQRKTGRPAQFELTEQAPTSVHAWLQLRGNHLPENLFPSRIDRFGHQCWTDYGECRPGRRVCRGDRSGEVAPCTRLNA